MSQATKQKSSALVPTLPERVFTRSGASFDPRLDVWAWPDGPYAARLDFGRFTGSRAFFKTSLKAALLPYIKGHSAKYVTNLFEAFVHFLDSVLTYPTSVIGERDVANYAAKLRPHEKYRVGTLNGLLQKWVALHLPGVTADCAAYLREHRKPGNTKGDAVRTRDPIKGPFSEDEYKALYSAVNAAYGIGDMPLWALLLTRVLLACGGRISQYASLKLCDFDAGKSVLKLPQVKTGLAHARMSFLEFDISVQTSQLIVAYRNDLLGSGETENSAFFPAELIMSRGPRRQIHATGDMFFGHCTPTNLSRCFENLLRGVAPPTSRLNYAPMPVVPQRFRYTFGTRLGEEGASKLVIAERLGHADLQNVECYVSASPKIVERYDVLNNLLEPLALAFKGNLVEDEAHSTNKGEPGSRIRDFRVTTEGLGSCAGKAGQCGFNKPVACYVCFRFEPWLDAPHEKVLARLEAERQKWSADDRMAAINDEPIKAVKEVIVLCSQVWAQRKREEGAA
ncbi:MAG: site-specific integrase [Comamonas sp.]|jgi:integrase|uniref:tyrosine-type recombinase/integrase n=1 Tax=Comamonas sp. TaxID=34028 RepID=UPI00284260EC|nr:tyrosine-type recombinase/integrase [Comamonas sp.]MDR3067161.1 site-specific integrase [Comamonas sp.]